MRHQLRIAIADDECDIRDYLERVLPRMGHEVVVVACDGRELVEKCRAADPDLVITDIRMPEMDGFHAAAAICEERPVPVVVMSAHFDSEHDRCAGMDHVLCHLVKPINRADLTSAMDRALALCKKAS
jgi:two-component system, response regulator PdtaR